MLLTGPSGSGKTTLMRMFAGLDRDFKGCIEDGPERPVILFQEDRLVETITVMSNLMAVTDDRKRALDVLSSVGLEGEEKSITSSLSGGMKRRLAIARMMLIDGDAVFLDEPFRGLDDETKERTAEQLSSFAGKRTLLLISHDDDPGIPFITHRLSI